MNPFHPQPTQEVPRPPPPPTDAEVEAAIVSSIIALRLRGKPRTMTLIGQGAVRRLSASARDLELLKGRVRAVLQDMLQRGALTARTLYDNCDWHGEHLLSAHRSHIRTLQDVSRDNVIPLPEAKEPS